jgi:hypothetical protein
VSALSPIELLGVWAKNHRYRGWAEGRKEGRELFIEVQGASYQTDVPCNLIVKFIRIYSQPASYLKKTVWPFIAPLHSCHPHFSNLNEWKIGIGNKKSLDKRSTYLVI